MDSFRFYWRNPGHWDVHNSDGRIFRIRGDRGDVVVHDERTRPRHPTTPMAFPSVAAATAWITETLMAEECPDHD